MKLKLWPKSAKVFKLQATPGGGLYMKIWEVIALAFTGKFM